jgi:hypothetical protein
VPTVGVDHRPPNHRHRGISTVALSFRGFFKMIPKPLLRIPHGLVLLPLVSLLSACLGSDGNVVDNTLTSSEKLGGFVSSYNSGLGALTTFNGLTDAGFIDLYDDQYLDGGQTKQQLRDALAQESDALATGAGLPLAVFPSLTLADAGLSNCVEATGICMLTVTVVNSDVDTTRATISTQVRYSDGKFRIYGDQQVAAI